MDVEPLFIREVLETAEQLSRGIGIKPVKRQHETGNPSFCVLRSHDGFEGTREQHQTDQIFRFDEVEGQCLDGLVEHRVGDLVVVVHDQQRRCT